MTARPKVDVGVVTWNTRQLTVDCLRRLLDNDQGCDLRLLVYDNASTDGTADAIAEAVPEAEIVRGDRNLGFARAVNLLLARAESEWFVALNSDAWPEPGAIGRLVESAMAHPRAAAVGARLLRPDGSLEHSTHPFPSLAIAIVDASGARRLVPRRWAEAHWLEGAWAHDRSRAVDWAVGAGLLLRRTAVDAVGGLDERFFMYVEDLEWCWRAHQGGWEIWFEPGAVIRHVGNASGERRFGDGRAALEAANLQVFVDEALGPLASRTYRALQLFALGRCYAAARLRRHAVAGHWRLQLRAALGLLPPPAIDGPPVPAEGDLGPDAPDISVVVATRGRVHLLERLVTALEKQTLAPDRFEVVVVDDCSDDNTADVLADLASSSPLQLRVLHTPVRQGPAAARNLGWRHARASLIAFTDDDCVPQPDWLRAGLAAAQGEPRVVVGRTRAPAEQLALAGRPFARALEVNAPLFFETCNVFYRRCDLAEVGGFDERFRRPGGEDTHLALRVKELGVSAVFEPGAVVHHDVRPGGFRAAMVESTRWADVPLALKGRPYARRQLAYGLFFWRGSHPRVLLALAGLAVSLRWRPAALLVLPWAWWRLRRVPVADSPLARLWNLPGAFALDLSEVVTMLRGSWRHRTPLL